MKTERDKNFWSALFEPDSIAIVGANNNPGTWGYKTMLTAINAVKTDSRKQAYAVNANTAEVQGARAYPSLLDIPGPVELVIIVVRADIAPSIMEQCAAKGVKAVVIISAGFAEMGPAGAKLQSEVVEIARRGGIHLVGPNCNGHFNSHNHMGSAADIADARPGPVALITQSGTLGGTIVQTATGKGLGFSKYISTGNEADLHFEDYLEYLAEDPDTRVITGYIEGLREGRRFYELAKAITLKKPMVMIKTGTTERSSQAARSHTGTLAGGDAAYAAAFKQAGVIRVEDDEELCDMASVLVNMPLPEGKRVGIVTVGGGFGVMAAEACEKEGLQIPSLDPRTIQEMNAILPHQWSHTNPVDIVNILTLDQDPVIHAAMRHILEDPNIDVIITLLPPVTAMPENMKDLNTGQIREMQKKYQEWQEFLRGLVQEYGKPIINQQAYFNKPPQEILEGLSDTGIRIPDFAAPRRIAWAISKADRYREYLEDTRV